MKGLEIVNNLIERPEETAMRLIEQQEDYKKLGKYEPLGVIMIVLGLGIGIPCLIIGMSTPDGTDRKAMLILTGTFGPILLGGLGFVALVVRTGYVNHRKRLLFLIPPIIKKVEYFELKHVVELFNLTKKEDLTGFLENFGFSDLLKIQDEKLVNMLFNSSPE